MKSAIGNFRLLGHCAVSPLFSKNQVLELTVLYKKLNTWLHSVELANKLSSYLKCTESTLGSNQEPGLLFLASSKSAHRKELKPNSWELSRKI